MAQREVVIHLNFKIHLNHSQVLTLHPGSSALTLTSSLSLSLSSGSGVHIQPLLLKFHCKNPEMFKFHSFRTFNLNPNFSQTRPQPQPISIFQEGTLPKVTLILNPIFCGGSIAFKSNFIFMGRGRVHYTTSRYLAKNQVGIVFLPLQ